VSGLGLGVMINMLAGNAGTVEAVRASIGQTIRSVALVGETLTVTFESGDVLRISDEGQSCCESRYMTCGDLDNADYYAGAMLVSIEERDAPSAADGDDYGEHEIQFLVVTTSKGVITAETHNEHNGYYGGFSLTATLSHPHPSQTGGGK
jgi:hypothetical protein